VTDGPLYRDRVRGIEIGQAGLAAAIRVPSDRDPSRRMSETREFGTTRREVPALADWLRAWQVPAVVMVMEATGDYRKPVFCRLEAEGLECVLAGALLSHPGTRYEDLGASWYDSERQAARRVSHHVGALGATGYEVTLCRRPEPGEPAPAA
jgi:hypothetical protein